MKIVHVTIARQLTQGQIKQLRFEHAAAETLECAEWSTVAYHRGAATEPFIRTIPRIFRPMFLRKLYGWIVVMKLSKSHDVVMMRHMTFDFFAFLFAPFINNRISVHHAKEIEELRLIRKGWKGLIASRLERTTGRIAARNAIALVGVTNEIAEYERSTHAPDKPIGVYPNGIDPDLVPLLEDARSPRSVEAAFICGTFSEWHGLDKLILAVDVYYKHVADPLPLTIHLIGRLTDAQLRSISETKSRQLVFKHYGLMAEEEYRPILARCDVGIASLAMERQNLSEGSTLKVREMLAMGLAVYSGHKDVALPSNVPFVVVSNTVALENIINLAKFTKKISRYEIRDGSLDNIKKSSSLLSVCRLVNGLSL